MRVGLIGNYGATNTGDEAILASILKNHPAHSLGVFSADPQDTTRHHGILSIPLFPCGIRSLFKNGFKTSMTALQKVDAVVFGGGGLMQDDKPYACLIWAWQIFWVKRLKKPLFIYATGVGPLHTPLGRKLTKYVYDYAKIITVRDESSAELLRKIGVDASRIHITADPAWLIAKPQPKNRTKNLFIINLRPWKNHDRWTLDTLTKFLDLLKEKSQARFRFVVMQEVREEDTSMLRQMANHFNEQIFCPRDLSELAEWMAEAEAAIGMRYHFALAALLAGTPCLGIGYSPKVQSLFQPLPQQFISLPELSFERLQKSWEYISNHADEIAIKEKEWADRYRQEAQKNIDRLEVFLKGIGPQ